ncbi:MAG: EamA family transporter [Candidatus Firestonebacteria bacterium]
MTLILVSVFLIALGQVFWKLGTNQTGPVSFSGGDLIPSLIKMVSNLWFVLGCIMLLLSSVLWVIALGMVDLSFAFPFQALAFALIFIFSIFLFKEPVTLLKVIGTLLIIIGVIVVSKSK